MWLPQPPRRTATLLRVAVRFEPVRSAEPPRSSGSSGCNAAIAFCEALREAMLAACVTVAASSRTVASCQFAGSARRRTRRSGVPGGPDFPGNLERSGRPTQARAGCGGLCRAKGGTVYIVCARLVGAAVTDHGPAAHERRPATVLARLRQGCPDGRSVVAGGVAYDTTHV